MIFGFGGEEFGLDQYRELVAGTHTEVLDTATFGFQCTYSRHPTDLEACQYRVPRTTCTLHRITLVSERVCI